MNRAKFSVVIRLWMLFLCLMAAQQAYAQPATIMVVGDSISAGWERPSYRMSLVNTLLSENCDIDMVGDQSLTTYQYYNPSTFPGYHFPSIDPSFNYPSGSHWDPALGDDTDHQAFPGIRTEQLANGVATVSPIATYVSAQQPDYILLQTGSNDLNLAIGAGMRTDAEINTWANETISEIRLIVDRAIAAHQNPNRLKILIGNYIPNYTTHTASGAQDAANRAAAVFTQKVEAFIESTEDPRVLLVDVASGYNLAQMAHDGLHPNVIGENHIAGAFLTVLRGAGLCSENYPMVSLPTNGSSVYGDRLTVRWLDNGVNMDRWRVYVGSTQSGNSADYFDSGYQTGTSRTVDVTGLPEDGSNVFITLEYRVGGTTDITMSSFFSRAQPSSGTDPEMYSPVPGSTLTGSSATFRWRANSTSVIQWWLRVGSSVGAEDYYTSDRITDPAQLAEVVTGLPTNGETVYVSLFYKTPPGPWGELRYTLTAASESGTTSGGTTTGGTTTGGTTTGGTTTGGTTTGGTTTGDGTTTGGTDGKTTGGGTSGTAIVSPVAGSTLPGSSAVFTWDTDVTGVFRDDVHQWWFRVGSTSGAADYFDSGRITNANQRSVTATGLPTDGSTVHVRLQYKLPYDPWAEVRYTYTAASSSGGTTSGGTTSGTTTSGSTTSGSTTSGSTTSGGTTTGGGTDSTGLVSPAAGFTLPGSSAVLTWDTNVTGVFANDVHQWWVRVGSSSGGTQYFDSGRITNANQRSVTATNLPTDGSTVHVMLQYKRPYDPWEDVRYTFTAASSSGGTTTSGTTSGGTTSGGTTTGGTTSDGTTSGGTTTGGTTTGGTTTGGTTTGGGTDSTGLVSPAAGSTLPGSSAVLTWDTDVTGVFASDVHQWWVRVGSSSGGSQYYDSGRITNANQRSVTATGLPTNGSTVHVMLQYKRPYDPWEDVRYTFKAASSGSGTTTGGTTTGGTTTGGTTTGGTTTGGTTTGGTTTGGGTSPPALNLSTVRWLHTDVSGWAESANLASVTVTSSQVCMDYNKANSWPVKNVPAGGNTDLVGNPWVFIWNESQNAWYGATWEWLRPGQTCKAKKSVNSDHIKVSPYTAASGWKPKSGETLYFMVSGLARTGDRNVLARTKPVKVIWP